MLTLTLPWHHRWHRRDFALPENRTGICPGPLPRASIVDIDIAQDYSMAMARK
jgi:hypothetical protein